MLILRRGIGGRPGGWRCSLRFRPFWVGGFVWMEGSLRMGMYAGNGVVG